MRSPQLAGRVLVVSPHLDDAVLSLGAAASYFAGAGGEVTVLTVFAGDPDSPLPAGKWDADSGFRSSAQAARARREEDRRACELLGLTQELLSSRPAGDTTDEQLAEALAPRLTGVDTILIPGFPLTNRDHVRVSRAALSTVGSDIRVALYTEQPYAWWHRRDPLRRRPPREVPELELHDLRWTPLRARWGDRYRKLRACGAYPTQTLQFGLMSTSRTFFYELRRRGELVAWLPDGD